MSPKTKFIVALVFCSLLVVFAAVVSMFLMLDRGMHVYDALLIVLLCDGSILYWLVKSGSAASDLIEHKEKSKGEQAL